tara:strand:+ start:691 stop:1107 length:417 start_codon:yes stop_codon:yes gene_type:complete
MDKKVYIASDHAGFALKSKLCNHFKFLLDLGTNSEKSVDYPDLAHKLTNEVLKDSSNFGILICGSGVGMSMAANRVTGIRAGLVYSNEISRLIRQHNNANVLVLPGRFMDEEEAKKSVKTFIETEFEAGRHQTRIDKI